MTPRAPLPQTNGLIRLPLDAAITPGDALRALAPARLPFCLVGEWAGGGAILGCEPLRVVHGPAAFDVAGPGPDGSEVGGFDAADTEGIVGGGWFGYLGYQLGAAVEALPPPPPRPAPLPTAQMAYYDHVLRLDRAGRWWFEAVSEEAAAANFEALKALLAEQAAEAGSGEPGTVGQPAWQLGAMQAYGAGGAGHIGAVEECLREIAAGDLFQANLCMRLQADFSGSAAEAFIAAADKLRPAYGAFIGTGAGAVLSFSPELFLRRQGQLVKSAPIKGTAARTGDAEAAGRARAALATSAKDAAENVMIVDLMRNDLGRVAVYGSVEADPEPTVQAHPGVWHLVGEVRAQLRDGVSDGDLLRATFPPGSVTGAPKVQAMKVISSLESSAREVYTGAIGYMGTATGLELSVAIRTLEVSGGQAWLGCGGGVVADSAPLAELREAYGKAEPILAALGSSLVADPVLVADPALGRVESLSEGVAAGAATGAGPWGRRLARRPEPARGLFETILVSGGVAVDLERHLQRLAASVLELFGSQLPGNLTERAAMAAAACGRERSRMRIVFDPDGEVELSVTAAPAAAEASAVVLTPVTVPGGLGAHKSADREPLREFEQGGGAALICDADGQILEASWASVWVLVGGKLLTSPADGRILPGVVRARMLEQRRFGDAVAQERAVGLQSLANADGLLTTSSIRLAAPAALAGSQPTPAAIATARSINAWLQASG